MSKPILVVRMSEGTTDKDMQEHYQALMKSPMSKEYHFIVTCSDEKYEAVYEMEVQEVADNL